MATPIEQQPFGPDLSHHNGTVNFDDMKRGGASFVILKASQVVADPNYRFNHERAHRAGLMTGSYHFLSYEHDARDQARVYMQTVGDPGPGEMPPIVDCEDDDDDPETHRQYTRVFMAQKIADYVSEIHRLTGKWPMIYTYPYFWKTVLGNPALYSKDCPLWIADYANKRPRLVGGWAFHTFHQFTSTGHLLGVPGAVDLNRFNGSLERLRIFAGRV